MFDFCFFFSFASASIASLFVKEALIRLPLSIEQVMVLFFPLLLRLPFLCVPAFRATTSERQLVYQPHQTTRQTLRSADVYAVLVPSDRSLESEKLVFRFPVYLHQYFLYLENPTLIAGSCLHRPTSTT